MPTIVISEINLIKDYIEIKNISSSKINLKNWKIVDTTPTNQNRHEFIFKNDFWILSGEVLKIWSGIGKDDSNNIYQNRKVPIWNNPGDIGALYDSHGNEVYKKVAGVSGTVNGRVIDAETRKGIDGSEVSGEMQINSATTHDGGQYSLELLGTPNGITRKISAKAEGYASKTNEVVVKSNSATTSDFALSKGSDGEIAIDLSIKDTSLIINKFENGQINPAEVSSDKDWKVDWGNDYDIKIIYQNNKLPITAFQSYIYESRKKDIWSKMPADSFGLPERAGIFYDDIIVAVYTNISPKNWATWKWWHVGWFWYAEKDDVQRRYYYKLKYYGKRGNIPRDAEQKAKVEISNKSVLVKVPKVKLDAFDVYNNMVSWGWVGVILTIGAIASGAGALIITAELTAALFAALGLGMEGTALGVKLYTEDVKDAARIVMEDPPTLVKNYKRTITSIKLIKKHRTNTNKIMFAISNNIKSAVLVDKLLYSAAMRGDKIWVGKHHTAKKNIIRELHNHTNLLKYNFIRNKKILSKIKFNKNKLLATINYINSDKNMQKRLRYNGVTHSDVKLLIAALQKNKLKLTQLNPNKLFLTTINNLKKLSVSL